MEELSDKFKEIKKALAALENKKLLTGADLVRVEKLFNEVMEQINKIRKEELGLDPESDKL